MNSLDLKKPKLLDLIATLSQNNAELRAKNRANERKRFEHLFPDIPTEDLTMTTEEEGTKKEQTIKSIDGIVSYHQVSRPDHDPSSQRIHMKSI